MRFYLVFFYFFGSLSSLLFAQNLKLKPIHSIEVEENGHLLKMPFVGGLTSVQVAKLDMNNDDQADLVIYDIYSNRFIVLTNNQGVYFYDTTQYTFPNAYGWVEWKDFNCDNIKDFVTYNNLGSIEIHKGFYTNNSLQFEKIQNNVFAKSFFGDVNVYASSIDKPSFIDVNGDGDIDMVNYNVSMSKLMYYENQQVEKNIPCDSVYFEIADFCWGNITENGHGTLSFRDTCNSKFLTPLGSEEIQHNGTAVCLYDVNGDSIKDALLSDLFFNSVNYLENVGSKHYASFLSENKNYPASYPIEIDYLPMPQFVDINDDNKDDCVVSNFSFTSSDANADNIWWYKNVSNNSSLQLEFQKKNFLLEDVIDVGQQAYPCLLDINNDGIKDLLISNGGQRKSGEQNKYFVKAYQNLGTNKHPKYNLVNTNFLNISQYGLTEIALTVGDINNDGVDEILAGTSDGFLVWWENISMSPISEWIYRGYLLKDTFGNPDTLGANLVPIVYDLDNDNLKDIIIGNKSGTLSFLKGNAGATPNFTKITTQLSNIQTNINNAFLGYATPFIADIDTNGIDDLILGTYAKGIVWYPDFVNNYTQANLEEKVLLESKFYRTIPAILENNIFLVGNSIGGISSYILDTSKLSANKISVKRNAINIYPNPTKNTATINLKAFDKVQNLSCFNLMGQAFKIEYQQAGKLLNISVEALPTGLYILQFQQKNEIYYTKVMKE